MMENGLVKIEMVTEFRFGVMEQSMRVNGSIIEQMVEGNFGILMAISLKENGKMIKLVEKAFTLILMEQNMKVIGWMTFNMDLE